MGGSGGGSTARYDPQRIKDLIRSAEDRTRDTGYETEVSGELADLLATYNDRDVDTIAARLDEIKELLEDDIEGSVDLHFGGSVEKHTYVDGLSDVDSLVFLRDEELESSSPREVLARFRDILADRLTDPVDIRQGEMAVTVTYPDDSELQLLPAIRTASGMRVAASGGLEWSRVVRPDAFATRLTDANRATSQKLVPTIKLAKGAIAQLPKDQKLSGYHVESLAVRIFDSYSGPKTHKAMMTHFFEQASEVVLSPVKDITGQSEQVDHYLGPRGSRRRTAVSASLNRIARRMKNADAAGSVEAWLRAIGATVP